MARLIPSSMFIKDPVDVLGNEHTIGLAEHAVRTHAVPYPHTRSGNVVFWDDFESSTLKADMSATAAGTYSRSTDYSHFGDFSMKMVTDATSGESCSAHYYVIGKISGKLGSVMMLRTSDPNTYYHIHLYKYDGTNVSRATIKVNNSDGKVYYGYPAPTNLVGTIDMYLGSASRQFVPIKLVVDFDNNKYDHVIVGNTEIDLSSYSTNIAASAIDPNLMCYVSFYTGANFSYTAYLDSVIITDNEP